MCVFVCVFSSFRVVVVLNDDSRMCLSTPGTPETMH